MSIRRTFFAGALFSCLGLIASANAADPLDDALAASRRGDFATALSILRPLADQGNAAAQYDLGVSYNYGQGVKQDFAEAAKWYRKAADQGQVNAQGNLATLYANGQGVPKDFAEAMKWYRTAAEQGDANAQFNLGTMYNKGEGVAQNYPEAAKWFKKAADQGFLGGQYSLGVMYFTGRGVPQNYAEAARLYELAGNQGMHAPQFDLGFMYAQGQGVAQDDVQAYKWYQLSIPLFLDRAVSALDTLAKKMSAAQIAEAQNLLKALPPQRLSPFFLFSDEGTRFAAQADLVGDWERIPFPPGTVNKFEPWPMQYQYFAARPDGRINWMMTSQRQEGMTAGQLDQTLDRTPANRYQFSGGFAVVTYPDIPNLKEVWLTRAVLKDTVIGGVESKAGDVLMAMLQNGLGGDIQPTYIRLLRRLPK